MTIQENKAIVSRFIEEVQNLHHLETIDELYSPAFVDHSSKTGQPGIEGVKAFFQIMLAAFPDMHFTIQQQIAEGDRVATYKTFHGTHLGNFGDIPATGMQVTVEVMDIVTIRDGKITAHWTV